MTQPITLPNYRNRDDGTIKAHVGRFAFIEHLLNMSNEDPAVTTHL
jgi:hypothetical protein